MRGLARLAAAIAFVAQAAHADPTPADLVAPADFDFYVLTLSWAPGFCDLNGAQRNREECAHPAGFVVHGLWPDSASGPDPSACAFAPDYISGPALDEAARVYPSRGLAIHEWREHGNCTGLEAADYFRAVVYARDKIAVPSALAHPRGLLSTSAREIEKQFQAANPGLTGESMAVTCVRGQLLDVRFCLTPDLNGFARCPKVTRRTCREASLSVSPAR